MNLIVGTKLLIIMRKNSGDILQFQTEKMSSTYRNYAMLKLSKVCFRNFLSKSSMNMLLRTGEREDLIVRPLICVK